MCRMLPGAQIEKSRVNDAAWLCPVLQVDKHFLSVFRRVSGSVHTDKSATRARHELSFHETLPGGLGLVPEGSKVQQPCICADLHSSARGPHVRLCLQQRPLPRCKPAGHSMRCSTLPGNVTAAASASCCVMLQRARAAGDGGHWSRATTAARCQICCPTLSCRLQALHATVMHSRPAWWIWLRACFLRMPCCKLCWVLPAGACHH